MTFPSKIIRTSSPLRRGERTYRLGPGQNSGSLATNGVSLHNLIIYNPYTTPGAWFQPTRTPSIFWFLLKKIISSAISNQTTNFSATLHSKKSPSGRPQSTDPEENPQYLIALARNLIRVPLLLRSHLIYFIDGMRFFGFSLGDFFSTIHPEKKA